MTRFESVKYTQDDSNEWHETITAAAKKFGRGFLARFSADFAERALPVWESRFPEYAQPREAIAAARAWAECPCEDHKADADQCFRAVARAADAADAAWNFTWLPPTDERYVWDPLTLVHARGDPNRVYDPPIAGEFEAAGAARWAAATAYLDRLADAANAALRASLDATWAVEDPDAEREWQRLRLAAYVLGEVAER